MKREILSRGKRVDNGEWVEGFYYCRDWENTHWIRVKKDFHFIDIKVIPETVGQLRYENKNGRYFDGDVYYHSGFGYNTVSDISELQYALLVGNADDIGEIIGNIHDNPELLNK